MHILRFLRVPQREKCSSTFLLLSYQKPERLAEELKEKMICLSKLIGKQVEI